MSEWIGPVRRFLFVPWDSKWNAIVRDVTAWVEGKLKSPAEEER